MQARGSSFLRIDLLIVLLAFPLLSAGCGPRQIWGIPADALTDALSRAEYSSLATVDFSTQDPSDSFAISPQAPFYLSFVFDSIDRPAQALRMLELAASRSPSPWKEEAGVLLAQRYVTEKSYDKAVDAARRALAATPAAAVGERARRALVEALYWNKNDTAVLQEASRLANPDAEVLLFRAVSSLRLHLDTAPGLVLQLFIRERASALHSRVYTFLSAEPAYLQVFSARDQDLLAAKDALSRADWAKGIPLMESVLVNLDPSRVAVDALVLDLGASCAAAGSFNTGARFLEVLAPRLTGQARVDALEQAGRLYHRARDDGRAAALLRTAAAEAPTAGQRDRARWSLLDIMMAANPAAFIDQVETESPSWNDPSYFSDLLERRIARLVAEKSWRTLIRLRDTMQKIGLQDLYAELSYIVARAVQEGEIGRLPGSSPPTARDLLTEAVKASPSGYYGIMSASMLGDLPDRAVPAAQTEAPVEKPALDKVVEGYIEFGLTRQAYALLWASRDALSDAQVLEAARRLAHAGDTRSSLYMVGALARRRRLSVQELELYYPHRYDTIIAPLAAAADIPDPLLYGLVREESYFDPDIVSSAGAVGLSQLMPATAADIATRLRIADPDLSDPRTNLTIGVRHFQDLLRKVESPTRALLAYNAGLGRVRQWERSSRGLPEDLFFESVPIAETRQYVRKILVSSVMYAFLYHDADPRDVALSFFRLGRKAN